MAFSTCLPVQETKSSGGIKYRSELAASVGARNRPQIRSWLSRHAFPYRRPRVQEESSIDLNWRRRWELETGRRSDHGFLDWPSLTGDQERNQLSILEWRRRWE